MSGSAGRCSILSCFLLVLLPPSLHSQTAVDTAPPVRVRLLTQLEPTLWRKGQLVMLSSDSVAIRFDSGGGTLSLALNQVTRLEQSRGTRRRTGTGAGVGLGIGLALGLGLGVATAASDCFGCEDGGAGTFFAAGMILGGLGAGLGAMIGTMSVTEDWKPIAAASPPRLTLRPAADRWQVGVQVGF
jgi:hypothetical protein